MSSHPFVRVVAVDQSCNYVWDVPTLAWVVMTQPGGSSGAGGDVNVTNASIAVTGTFWQATQPVSGTVTTARPTAAARTNVTAAAVDTALLAANTARFGATVWNDADKALYLALGSVAASTSSFTAQLAPNGYYETPFNYTGAVRGIWAANPTGSARVTEAT